MAVNYAHDAMKQLAQLVSDVVELCHGGRAVLRCGSTQLAESGNDAAATVVVAVQPFGVGTNSFELTLLDRAARELTLTEVGSFHALCGALRRQLEALEPSLASAEEVWVKDHVAVAIDYVTDSFLLLRGDWTIQHVNSTLERTVGQARAEMIGRPLWDVFPQVVGTRFEEEARAAMGSALPRMFELHSEQSDRWFQSRMFPCSEGLAILTADISERRHEEMARAELQRKSLQSQRLESLGSLAGGIAHDFNNILGAILGHAGLLHEQLPPGSPSRESVEQIAIAGRRARELVQQILTFARATARDVVRRPIRPMVEEALGMVRSTLASSAQIETTLSEDALITTLDSTEVQQVVTNLATNASHALGADGGRIVIELRRVIFGHAPPTQVGQLTAGPYVELLVRDSGSGMPRETLLRLFEPFFTTKRRGQGTGLGLHVVHGIVTAHGGAIVVDSELGQGSVFRVYLPAAERADEMPVVIPAQATRLGRGERVAYLEDDDVVRLMVQRVLDYQGFSVTPYANPTVLIQAIGASPHSIDLLVTDYSMPVMNGVEVAQAVRSIRPDLPIIIATGYAQDELRTAVQALGGTELLNKERCFEELASRASWALRQVPGQKP